MNRSYIAVSRTSLILLATITFVAVGLIINVVPRANKPAVMVVAPASEPTEASKDGYTLSLTITLVTDE
jgi:hypothetical protein